MTLRWSMISAFAFVGLCLVAILAIRLWPAPAGAIPGAPLEPFEGGDEVMAGSVKFRPVYQYRLPPEISIDVKRALTIEREFAIDAGPLSKGLQQLLDSVHIPRLVSQNDIASVQAHAVIGKFTVAVALSRLLTGTGCQWESVGNNTVYVYCKVHYLVDTKE